MEVKRYKMRIVRGAFVEPKVIDDFGAKVLEELKGSAWKSIDEVVCDLQQIKELQKNMINHFEDSIIPWYTDGYNMEDKNDVIVAFGADDGEDGNIFQFKRNNEEAISEVIKYGIKKGIPKEQMDFMDTPF